MLSPFLSTCPRLEWIGSKRGRVGGWSGGEEGERWRGGEGGGRRKGGGRGERRRPHSNSWPTSRWALATPRLCRFWSTCCWATLRALRDYCIRIFLTLFEPGNGGRCSRVPLGALPLLHQLCLLKILLCDTGALVHERYELPHQVLPRHS